MICEDARGWTKFVLELVQGKDPTATLCLDGDEWLVEVEGGPSREVCRVRVVAVDVAWRRVVSHKTAA